MKTKCNKIKKTGINNNSKNKKKKMGMASYNICANLGV